MSTDAPALHPIEQAILKALSNSKPASVESLAEASGLEIDQVRRGVEWLKFKNLITLDESSTFIVSLAAGGQTAVQSGLPERRLGNAIKEGKSTMAEILASGRLKKDEVNAAVAAAKRNKWIQFVNGSRMALVGSASNNSAEEVLLQKLVSFGSIEVSKLTEGEKQGLESLKKRPDYVVQKEQKSAQISLADAGRALLHTLDEEQAERRLTAEIDGPIVQSGFWNFDALFTPQDHPAREMQDTFYILGQRQSIPASKDQIAKVSRVHQQRWGAEWDAKEAERMVLRTHTTPVTLQHLAKVKPKVGRLFSVGRVFRNEKVSYKHLVEFHQVEGVATAPGASLRDLMGLQKEFYAKMGMTKIKFWPTFFPYTEPSLQSMVYNEKLEKWIELFGMGIFRPEVTKPLGIKNPVLAWGGGLERIAMLRFGLDDVRELYSSRLAWLRSVPRCQL